LFEKFDADGSGDLDKEEVKLIIIDIMKTYGATKLDVSSEMGDKWIEAADKNGDSKISREEAEIFAKTHLSKLL
jgi:Ca2+-binding EF-hand superfamily protein